MCNCTALASCIIHALQDPNGTQGNTSEAQFSLRRRTAAARWQQPMHTAPPLTSMCCCSKVDQLPVSQKPAPTHARSYIPHLDVLLCQLDQLLIPKVVKDAISRHDHHIPSLQLHIVQHGIFSSVRFGVILWGCQLEGHVELMLLRLQQLSEV